MLSLLLFRLGRIVFDLAFDNVIQAAVVAHPSLLNPEDLDVRHSFIVILKSPLRVIRSQTYIARSKAPLLINSCEDDGAFPKSFAETADQKFANFAPGYRRTYYEGASHGFAVRGDIVRENVYFVTLSRCSFCTPCPEQADSEGRQGRRFQGVC